MDKILNVAQAAKLLGLCKDSVYELARRDRIPYAYLGGALRFSSEQLLTWVHNGGTGKKEVSAETADTEML